jgi:peptide/nickel transport system substrate-binding protein
MRVTHSVSRRQFLQTTAGFAGSLLALAAAGGTAAPAFAAPAVFAQATPPDVPRNRTMISAGLGGEMPGGYTDIDNFNPFSPGLSRSGFYQAATEPLFYYNMLGDDFTPWLAEGYAYTPDNTGLTINLRQGPAWSDGTPFTSKDVAFTLTTMKNNPDLLNAAEISRVVSSVATPDDKTVNITFTEPSPRFHWNFLTFRADIGISILPEHVWNGQDPHTFTNYDPSKGWPLGTGAYKLVSTDVQQKSWDVRPDWWAATSGFRPLPQVQRLTFLPGMNEITMAQMLIANQIDIAFSLTPGNLRLVQSQNQNIITHSSTPPYGYMDWWPISLAFNTTVKPFDDPEIRWAISYALDRDEIVNFAFQGFSQAAPLPYPPYPGLQKYFDGISDLTTQYPTNKFDTSQTDAIMGRKGYTKNGDGMWVDASGQKISFQIVTFPQHPSTTPQAPIVSQQLKKAGFDASFLLPADFYTRITSGDAVAYLWGHGGSMNDPFDTLDIYNIRYVKPAGQAIFNGNIYRWSNQEYSDIVDKMRLLPLNDPQVMDLWHQAMAIWLPNLPDVQLIQTVIAVPMNTTYWTNWPQGDHPVIHEGFWHRTADLMFETLKPVQ